MGLSISRGGHVYAAFPSSPNPNEAGFPSHLVKQLGEFPVRACITGTLSPNRKDQLSVGCCTGEGSTNFGNRLYRRYVWSKTGGNPVDFDPLFTYYFERVAEGTISQGDVGAQVVTSCIIPDCNPGAKALGGGYGWCPQTGAFDVNAVNVAPTPQQILAAKQYPGGAFHNIGNVIANMKSCIVSDYSGVIGISVYQSFEDDATTASGLIPYPNVNAEQFLGGHEMHSLIAYDDTIQCPNSPNPGAFLTENSWGDQWGCECSFPSLTAGRGFCWLSYDYLANVNLTSDVRMGHLGPVWVAQQSQAG